MNESSLLGGTFGILFTILVIAMVVYYGYSVLNMIKSNYVFCLAKKSIKYKLIFVIVSFNIIVNVIIRQVFPGTNYFTDLFTALGFIASIICITIILYFSEEMGKNTHKNNFQKFKINKP